MKHLRKAWLPWTAADQFPDREAFNLWLERRLKLFGDLRLLLLAAAAALLVVGYVLDRRPVMLASVLPLALVLGVSVLIGRTEEARDQNNTGS